MKSSRTLSALFALGLFLLILTVSIGLPIYLRPFYYAHIDTMGLPEYSGYSRETIRTAYDAVLDYLTLPGRTFSTGALPHSQEGAAHFADCKVLFDLNRNVLLGPAAVLAVLGLLRKTGKAGPYRLGKHSAARWAAIGALIAPVVIGGLAAADFDRFFTLFHAVFFPGKDNWLFHPQLDPVILILPQEFFRNCAILILVVLLLTCTVLILLDRKQH